eukprot:11728019-Karenia_brevis.AAC.1
MGHAPELKSGIAGEIVEKTGNCQSMYGTIVFQGMRWGVNGQFWWGREKGWGYNGYYCATERG